MPSGDMELAGQLESYKGTLANLAVQTRRLKQLVAASWGRKDAKVDVLDLIDVLADASQSLSDGIEISYTDGQEG